MNFHTIAGRYAPFAAVLRRDGYVVQALSSRITEGSLAACRVLVISNALSEANQKHWKLPAHSAFDEEEVVSVERWVRDGGSLLLIADHMPWPGSTADLAAAFGILFSNGYATDGSGTPGEMVFKRSNGSLTDHPITRGRLADERVDSVMTFTGQAFRTEIEVSPLLILPRKTLLLMPTSAEKLSDKTPQLPAAGMLQGAAAMIGRGRLAVFGEAAMFTAQVDGKDSEPFGMNVPEANQNVQLLLNVLHWLSGALPDS